jgi:hypothetical protein
MNRCAALLVLLTGISAAFAQAGPTNVCVTIQSAAALHGRAIPPYAVNDVHFDGVTVFCSVVVENRSGKDLTWPVADTSAFAPHTEFDNLELAICDETGKALSRHQYILQGFPRTRYSGLKYLSVPQGCTTNQLYYMVNGVPTNSEMTVRLEGYFGANGSFTGFVTSNIVKATLY